MDDQATGKPKIVTYKIPQIDIYHVTEDELIRIEEGCSEIGQDLTFATISLTLLIAFIISLVTTSISEPVRSFFVFVTIVAAVVFLYTGSKWWRRRRTTPNVIAKIRSRKVDPAPD
jgi:hypothetical protein